MNLDDLTDLYGETSDLVRRKALDRLDAHDIVMVGRYARWIFQGIADSIRDGLMAGAALRNFGF